MIGQTYTEPELEIPELINELRDLDSLKRQHARISLVRHAQESIPALLAALKDPNVHVRWNAVLALGEIKEPETAEALSEMLMDDDIGVRWASMESLIRLERHSLRPVLERFKDKYDSIWMREGVHHILHALKDRHKLNEGEIILFEELDKNTLSGYVSNWTSEQVRSAEEALRLLEQED